MTRCVRPGLAVLAGYGFVCVLAMGLTKARGETPTKSLEDSSAAAAPNLPVIPTGYKQVTVAPQNLPVIPKITKKGLSAKTAKPQIPLVPGKNDETQFAEGRVLLKLDASGIGTMSVEELELPGVQELRPFSSWGKSASTAAASVTGPRWFRAMLEAGKSVEQAVQELRALPGVLHVEPDYLRVPFGETANEANSHVSSQDPLFSQQYALRLIQAEAAWQIHGGDRNVLVAVIDTGIQMDHPDLAGVVWRNPNESPNGADDDGNGLVDDVHGWNFEANTADLTDNHGHGTHVSGIIAAARNNGLGVAGVANVSILPIQVFGADGFANDSDIIEGIRYAVAKGAEVINMSLGGGDYSQAFADACAEAVSRNTVVVAAAGNKAAPSPEYPAAYEGVISVGATDSNDQLAEFSGRGSGHTLHVVAPGVSVLSTLPPSTYESWSGTSMASPYVAGLAALIRSSEPALSANQVQERLCATADDLGDPGWDTTFGFGRINAYRALTEGGAIPPFPEPEPWDDAYEENDSSDQAASISEGSYSLEGWDEDWFIVSVSAGSEVSVNIGGPTGDLDLFLFDGNGNRLGQSDGGGSQESVSATVTTSACYIAVAPFNGQGSSYTMSVDVSERMDDGFEENDLSNQAASMSEGTYGLQGWDQDWFLVATSAGSQVIVNVSGPAGDLDLFLFDGNGSLLGQSDGAGSQESVSAMVTTSTCYIAVAPFNGQGSSYTVGVDVSGGCVSPDDRFEENDFSYEATPISVGIYTQQGCDDDWFVVPAAAGSQVIVNVSGPAGDLDLFLFDGNGNLLSRSIGDGSQESVEAVPTTSGCYIAVAPFNGQSSSYTMSVNVLDDDGGDGNRKVIPPGCGSGAAGTLGFGALPLLAASKCSGFARRRKGHARRA